MRYQRQQLPLGSIAAALSDGACPVYWLSATRQSKIEFHFPFPGEPVQLPFFDISLVDGYTLKSRIAPNVAASGNCTDFTCGVSFNSCPSSESLDLGISG